MPTATPEPFVAADAEFTVTALLRTGTGFPCVRPADPPRGDDYRADVVAQARLLTKTEAWVWSGPRWRDPMAGWLGSLAGLASLTGRRVGAIDHEEAWIIDDAYAGEFRGVVTGTPVAREYVREQVDGTTLWIDTGRLMIAGPCERDPAPSPTGTTRKLPEPGAPYSAEEIARRIERGDESGGLRYFPRDIAAKLAERLVTFDGRPYADLQVLTGCSTGSCGVTFSGSIAGDAERYFATDSARFRVDRATGVIEDMNEHQLYSRAAIPNAYHAEIERRIRALRPAGLPADAGFERALWLPPPRFGQFVARYGVCTTWNVVYDWNRDRVLSVTEIPPQDPICG